MSINSSLLKSPSVIGGTSLAGAGGVGVGSWQIYEAVNPTLDKQLQKEGYSYSPIDVPKKSDPSDNKFHWESWGCLKKLFPNITVSHTYELGTVSTSDTSGNDDGKKLTIPTGVDDFVACAMLDLRPLSLGSNTNSHKNRIYFKSEIVVKGKDYGWAMGNGLTTAPTNIDSSYKETLNFEYRLLLFKKENNAGKIDKGFGWDNHKPTGDQDLKNQKFTIRTPMEMWLKDRKFDSEEPIPKKTGAGIGRVMKEVNADSIGTHIIDSMDIYMNYQGGDNNPTNAKQNAEFFGNNGKGQNPNQVGYLNVGKTYENGGKTISSKIQLSKSLENGYKPYGNKQIKGMNLKDGCNHGSGNRNKSPADISDYIDESIRDMCYTKSSK